MSIISHSNILQALFLHFKLNLLSRNPSINSVLTLSLPSSLGTPPAVESLWIRGSECQAPSRRQPSSTCHPCVCSSAEAGTLLPWAGRSSRDMQLATQAFKHPGPWSHRPQAFGHRHTQTLSEELCVWELRSGWHTFIHVFFKVLYTFFFTCYILSHLHTSDLLLDGNCKELGFNWCCCYCCCFYWFAFWISKYQLLNPSASTLPSPTMLHISPAPIPSTLFLVLFGGLPCPRSGRLSGFSFAILYIMYHTVERWDALFFLSRITLFEHVH